MNIDEINARLEEDRHLGGGAARTVARIAVATSQATGEVEPYKLDQHALRDDDRRCLHGAIVSLVTRAMGWAAGSFWQSWHGAELDETIDQVIDEADQHGARNAEFARFDHERKTHEAFLGAAFKAILNVPAGEDTPEGA